MMALKLNLNIMERTKLILYILLTFAIYIWIFQLSNDIIYSYKSKSIELINTMSNLRPVGVYILYIKPIFLYISGIFIISKLHLWKIKK